MAYLTTRIQRLMEDLRSGRTTLLPQAAEQLEPELARVRFYEDGSVDLSSCSEHLRAFARAYNLAADARAHDKPASESVAKVPDPNELAELNRKLFDQFERMFVALL